MLQAVAADPTRPAAADSQAARFFVARDRPALTQTALRHPSVGSAQGQPEVRFGFTAVGGREFAAVTRRVADRGAHVSVGATKRLQHFAIALDGRLITVPQVDFLQYPDGVIGGGAEITGGLTAKSARELVTVLRHGALPVALTPTAR